MINEYDRYGTQARIRHSINEWEFKLYNNLYNNYNNKKYKKDNEDVYKRLPSSIRASAKQIIEQIRKTNRQLDNMLL